MEFFPLIKFFLFYLQGLPTLKPEEPGKSSFLKIYSLLSHPTFWFSPINVFQEHPDLRSFEDMVSAWSKDQTFFRIGTIQTKHDKNTSKEFSGRFTIHTFENNNGIPSIAKYMQFSNNQLVKIIFKSKSHFFKLIKPDCQFRNEDELVQFFKNMADGDNDDKENYSELPNKFPVGLPLPFVLSFIKNFLKETKEDANDFEAEPPFSVPLTDFAPIRTRPMRIYEGLKRGFSPEGEHAFVILRDTLRMKTKSIEFVKKLNSFGKESGLFESVIEHSFGDQPTSPFEILIKFKGANLNISNVGYGVSQVLPLIVDLLSKSKSHSFSIQQPEVHLHPKAQAAFGDFICQLIIEKNFAFLIETHSDYLIDRCRLFIKKSKGDFPSSQVVFFQRTTTGNHATIMNINNNGGYPVDQPNEYRDFFIKEELNLLKIQ